MKNLRFRQICLCRAVILFVERKRFCIHHLSTNKPEMLGLIRLLLLIKMVSYEFYISQTPRGWTLDMTLKCLKCWAFFLVFVRPEGAMVRLKIRSFRSIDYAGTAITTSESDNRRSNWFESQVLRTNTREKCFTLQWGPPYFSPIKIQVIPKMDNQASLYGNCLKNFRFFSFPENFINLKY